jgi:hypothetical protein
MSGSRLISFGRVMLLAGALTLAGSEMAQAQLATVDASENVLTTVTNVLTQAKNAADEVWQKAQSVLTGLTQANTAISAVQAPLTTMNTAATGAAVIQSTQAQIAANSNIADSTNGVIRNVAVQSKQADELMKYKGSDLALICPQTTLVNGLDQARAKVEAVLKPSTGSSQKITGVRQSVGAAGTPPTGGMLQSDANITFDPTKSLSQQKQEMSTDIHAYFCDTNSEDPGSCNAGGLTPAHADTDVLNFFRDRTFNDTEELGFDQFEKYVCDLVPENTPKSTAYYQTGPGMDKLVDQHKAVAWHNLCLQAYNEFYANHLPVVDSTTNAAIADIYKNTTAYSANPLSPIANAGVMSREELIFALYQGYVEGTNGSTNIFSQLAGLEALPTLKFIATEGVLTNYMLYDLHEKAEESNMYLSIIAKQSLSGGAH